MAIEITSESLAGDTAGTDGRLQGNPAGSGVDFPGSSRRSSRFAISPNKFEWTRRNFSSRARELSGGDAIILSIAEERTHMASGISLRLLLQTLRP